MKGTVLNYALIAGYDSFFVTTFLFKIKAYILDWYSSGRLIKHIYGTVGI